MINKALHFRRNLDIFRGPLFPGHSVLLSTAPFIPQFDCFQRNLEWSQALCRKQSKDSCMFCWKLQNVRCVY